MHLQAWLLKHHLICIQVPTAVPTRQHRVWPHRLGRHTQDRAHHPQPRPTQAPTREAHRQVQLLTPARARHNHTVQRLGGLATRNSSSRSASDIPQAIAPASAHRLPAGAPPAGARPPFPGAPGGQPYPGAGPTPGVPAPYPGQMHPPQQQPQQMRPPMGGMPGAQMPPQQQGAAPMGGEGHSLLIQLGVHRD